MVKIIADPGSCHLGNYKLAEELIKVSIDCGADAVKFQLIKKEKYSPNTAIEYDVFEGIYQEWNNNIEIFASVWDNDGINELKGLNCKSVKLAYSQNKNYDLMEKANIFPNYYLSGDCMTNFYNATVKLYCIPEYPVKYVIDWEGIFPRFDGFSSHCLGIKQDIAAVKAGANYIEKHIRLDDSRCDNVPDGKFALRPKEFESLVNGIRHYQSLK